MADIDYTTRWYDPWWVMGYFYQVFYEATVERWLEGREAAENRHDYDTKKYAL